MKQYVVMRAADEIGGAVITADRMHPYFALLRDSDKFEIVSEHDDRSEACAVTLAISQLEGRYLPSWSRE